MRVQMKASALKKTRWYEYLVRFVFGGLVTVVTGLVAHRFGPVIGGLFLAFPAIFPASVTLVQSHEQKDKQKVGHDGASRGSKASGADSAGAAWGSVGLVAFGAVVWWLGARLSAWALLPLATAVWLAVAVAVWMTYQWCRGKTACLRTEGKPAHEPMRQAPRPR